MLYGSLAALDRTIKILHSIGYADPNDWSDPIPVPPSGNLGDASPGRTAAQTPNQWMVIMTKTVSRVSLTRSRGGVPGIFSQDWAKTTGIRPVTA
jgi:hypothetical protein